MVTNFGKEILTKVELFAKKRLGYPTRLWQTRDVMQN